MKKSMRLIFLVLILAMVGGTGVIVSAKAPVTISFWFPGADNVNNSYFLNVAREFEKTHPQIKVEVTQLPATQADIDLKLNAALLGGTYPDILSAYLSQIGSRGPKGDFYPLDGYVNKWNEKGDIIDSVWDIGKYKGKILGVGFYPNPEVLTYRKDFFREAGLAQNQPPANWNELAAYAQKLTVRDDKNNVVRAGFDIPAINSAVFVKGFAWENGALIIDEKKQKPMLDDPALIAVMERIINLKKENVSIPFDYQKRETVPFMNGKGAMSFLQPTQILTMIKNDPSLKDNLGFAPPLTGKKKAAYCGYRLFTIASTSKHRNESWEFIKFMMSKEQMRIRAKDLKIAVVRKSLEDEFIAADPTFNKILMEYVRYGKGDNVYQWNTLAVKYLHLAYEEAYSGKKTSAQALKDAQTSLAKELKSIGK